MTHDPQSGPRVHSGESPPSPGHPQQEEIPPPIGTLFLLMLYIMVLAGMWAAIYFEFLGM